MSFLEIANSSFVRIVCIAAVVVVVAVLLWFLVTALRQATKMGIEKRDIKVCIRTTLLVAIGPALSILIPMLAMMKLLGAPWSGLRLSVIGSAPMEMTFADMAVAQSGYGKLADAPTLPGEAFGIVVVCIAFGTIIGMVCNIFFNKKLSDNITVMRNKNASKLDLYTNALMGSVLAVLGATTLVASKIHCVEYYTAIIVFILVLLLVKKTQSKKLNEYSFTVALVISLVAAIGWNAILM